jgi:predicted metal-dependent hydrolase
MDICFKYENREIKCHVIRRKRKNITIRVDAGGEVTVLAPPGTSQKVILQQVLKRAGWIVKQIDYFKSRAPEPHLFNEGELFLFLGREYPLYMVLEPRRDIQVRLAPDKLTVLTPTADRGIIREKLESWYRQRAREIIYQRVEYYEDRIARVPGRIVIKSQKRRWGSCSTRGNLNFNWRIVMAPERVLDYVVVHELCHLCEMNHSPRFWHLVAQVIPDYKENKEWLQKNASRLIW